MIDRYIKVNNTIILWLHVRFAGVLEEKQLVNLGVKECAMIVI